MDKQGTEKVDLGAGCEHIYIYIYIYRYYHFPGARTRQGDAFCYVDERGRARHRPAGCHKR